MNTEENKDLAKSFTTFIKEACETTKNDITAARESGDKFAKELVAPLSKNETISAVLGNSASLMSQMVAGGFTLLMCPMKLASKELSLKK